MSGKSARGAHMVFDKEKRHWRRAEPVDRNGFRLRGCLPRTPEDMARAEEANALDRKDRSRRRRMQQKAAKGPGFQPASIKPGVIAERLKARRNALREAALARAIAGAKQQEAA